MTRYVVTSPKFSVVEWVCEFGGPTYDICDYAEVEASSRREAVKLAIKQWDSESGDHWPEIQRSDGKCPMTGVRAKTDAEMRAEALAAGPPDWLPQDGWGPDSVCEIGDCREPAVGWAWHDGPWREDETVTWGYFAACSAHVRDRSVQVNPEEAKP